MPVWVSDGFEDYRVRLRAPVSLDLIEIPAQRRGKNSDLGKIKHDEGRRLLEAIPQGAIPVALDPNGRKFDTQAFARLLQDWVDDAQDVAMLVGGPEGLSRQCLDQSRLKISLSEFTFAHPLVRVVIAEQIYRASSINRRLPYHR